MGKIFCKPFDTEFIIDPEMPSQLYSTGYLSPLETALNGMLKYLHPLTGFVQLGMESKLLAGPSAATRC